jgi:acyl-CoA hydrolase
MNDLLQYFQSGTNIYLPGASGEILALHDDLAAEPDRMSGVRVISCLLPGMNAFDYAALHHDARLATFMLPAPLGPSFDAGKIDLLPIPYSAIASWIGAPGALDVAVAHLSPPRNDRTCSVGIAADFSLIAWHNAAIRVAVINPAMPDIPGAPRIALDHATAVVECESTLVADTGAPKPPPAEITTIARLVAEQVPDGAVLQIGIGGAPGAIWDHLINHRNLVLDSGLISPGFLTLRDAGALNPAVRHRAGIAYGPTAFYNSLARDDCAEFAGVDTTHDACRLGRHDRFTAINSAMEVDLFGQINLEWIGNRAMSGVGGAPDFARAARRSEGGQFIIALPATARRGTVSRIMPRLATPTVSMARSDVDVIVTEYGTAHLRGLSVDQRAQALIALAAPEWRAELDGKWRELRNAH